MPVVEKRVSKLEKVLAVGEELMDVKNHKGFQPKLW